MCHKTSARNTQDAIFDSILPLRRGASCPWFHRSTQPARFPYCQDDVTRTVRSTPHNHATVLGRTTTTICIGGIGGLLVVVLVVRQSRLLDLSSGNLSFCLGDSGVLEPNCRWQTLWDRKGFRLHRQRQRPTRIQGTTCPGSRGLHGGLHIVWNIGGCDRIDNVQRVD